MSSFYRKNDGMYYLDRDGNECFFCEAMYVSQVMIDLITDEMIIDVELYNGITYKKIQIPREGLDRDIIKTLKKYGLSLSDTASHASAVQTILHDSEQDAERSYIHQRLGFISLNEQLIFLAYLPIGVNDQHKKESIYSGKAMVTPAGKLKSWKKIVQDEVIGHPSLELALAIGASSLVVHILRKERRLFAENPIWGIIGDSSTGKTTALRLMASVFGSPEESFGIIGDCNSTENAFYKRLGNLIGMPLIVDEATGKTNWNFADIIYNLSKGQDKDRCSSDGELKQRTEFSGTIVISGEKSILEECNPNSGCYARMQELNLNWTDSAEHAERLVAGLRQNYGTAVYPFMKFVLKLYRRHPKFFDKMFAQEQDKLKEQHPPEKNTDHRIYNIFAATLLSARILKRVLRLNLDIATMCNLLLEQHQKKDADCDDAQRLFDAVTEYAVRYGSKFVQASQEKLQFPTDVWGEYATDNHGKKYLWISQSTMEEIAQKYEISNFKRFFPILWQRKQMMRPEKDRFLGKHKLRGKEVKCYQFVISENDLKAVSDCKVKPKLSTALESLLYENDD